jgi:hypothetical protein
MSTLDSNDQQYYVAERHDTMLAFTIASIFVGLLAIPIGLSGFHDIGLPEILMMIGLVLASLLLIVGAIHTLKVTQCFTYWNHGITQTDRAIGWIIVTI